ncbi:MAG: hypothetical protein AB7K36_21345, partial [Chloroflexota bacterium]
RQRGRGRFFSDGPTSTRIELEHRQFERHGQEGAATWHAAMASSEGWEKFLERYASLPARA